MLLSLSVLPVILLFIRSGSSVDLYRSKRAPQELQETSRPYHLNHPPSVESYIPVTVVYDNEEDIHVLSKSIQQDKTITAENQRSNVSSNDDMVSNATQEAFEPRALYANHPPTVEDYNPIADNKEESNLKSITKTEDSKQETLDISLNKTNNVNNPNATQSAIKPKGRSVNFGNVSTSAKNIVKDHVQRRRLQRVNKVSINKNRTTDDKIEITTENVVEKVVISSKAEETDNNNGQSTRNINFKKRTQQRDPVVPIVNSENYLFAYNGDYHYRYEGGDGTKAFERGELKTVDSGSSGAGVVGGYSYKDKDGNDFTLSYTADENGYRPIGDHLPTPPPIPPAIQRALEYLATKTTPEPITEKVNKSY